MRNNYDLNRFCVTVLNWEKKATCILSAPEFFKDGDRFRVMDPKDLYGKPVLEGTCSAGKISLPTPGEFAVYVLLKGP
jgi:hypothetical protein